MIRRLLATALLLLDVEISAMQYIPMNPTDIVKANVSYRHHNRIGIKDDRIKKTFFKSSEIAVEMEEDSGQIFIQSMRSHPFNTTVSVVAESGIVQDIELTFEDGPCEVVVLQPPLDESHWEEESSEVSCSASAVVDDESVKELVNGFIAGLIPDGYVSIEDPGAPTVIKGGLTLQRLSRLVSDKEIVFVYRLKNGSKKDKVVTECQVNVLDGDWVFLDRYKVAPNEIALVLIGCTRI